MSDDPGPPPKEADADSSGGEGDDHLAKSTPSAKLADGWVPPENSSAARKAGFNILQSHSFERVMGVVIMFNFLVVIVETDNNAKDKKSADWVWWASWGLLTTFVIELTMKLYVFRRQFWYERWNVFDFFVITIDTTFSLLEVLGLSFLNVSMLRILRLSRLARATKVFRMFPELKLMLAGLAGAVNAICWGTMLLFVALLVWAVLAVQFIHPLNVKVHDDSNVYEGCARCPRAYESTFQACLTFTTQIVAGDSWGRETQPIIEKFPISIFFFMGVYVSVGLAIMNLILGVVVNMATEARDQLKAEAETEKLLMQDKSLNALMAMCRDMDDDGNDELTFDEVREGFDNNEDFRTTLSDMDIGRDDLQIVWTILDSDRSGTVTSKEFVNQIHKMKNSDSQFMLAYIKFYITEIKDKLRGELSTLGARLEKDINQLEMDVSIGEENGTGKGQSTATNIDDPFVPQSSPPAIAETTTTTATTTTTLTASPGSVQALDRQMRSLQMSVDNLQKMISGDMSSEVRNGQLTNVGSAAGNRLKRPFNNDLDSIDLLLEQDSLEALVSRLDLMDFEGALPVSSLSKVRNPEEVLAQLEGMWARCVLSVEDLRHFHTNLENLLETMVRRVSLSISQTVVAAMKHSADEAQRFTAAYRLVGSGASASLSTGLRDTGGMMHAGQLVDAIPKTVADTGQFRQTAI